MSKNLRIKASVCVVSGDSHLVQELVGALDDFLVFSCGSERRADGSGGVVVAEGRRIPLAASGDVDVGAHLSRAGVPLSCHSLIVYHCVFKIVV